MKEKTEQQPVNEQTPDLPPAPPKQRRPYTKPQLEVYGNIRELTHGGSPGTGDSGSPGTRRPV